MNLVFDWIITEINPGGVFISSLVGQSQSVSDQSKILHTKNVTHLPHYNV